MNWYRIWKRRRSREDLSELQPLIDSPTVVASFPDSTDELLVLPGPAHVAIKTIASSSTGDFRLATGDGDFWDSPTLGAGQFARLAFVEEGETLTLTNGSGGGYTDDVQIGVLDGFGRFLPIWVLTCV